MDFIKYCEENKDNCIILLKTPSAGKTVDNGMGVEFELSPFALICKDKEKIKFSTNIQDEIHINNEINIFEAENCSSIDEFIQELKEQDQYEVIWRNNDYKDLDRIKSELVRCGYDIELKASLFYKLKVSYEEIQKYFKQRTKLLSYQSDLFAHSLEDMEEFLKLVGKYFPLDRTHLKDCYFTAAGIEFAFCIEKKEEINHQRFIRIDEETDIKEINIQKKLEQSHEIMHDSIFLDELKIYIEQKLKEVSDVKS